MWTERHARSRKWECSTLDTNGIQLQMKMDWFLQRRLPQLMRATSCLLYTSDAADDGESVDLGGRRIIKKKKARISWAYGQFQNKKEIVQVQENIIESQRRLANFQKHTRSNY